MTTTLNEETDASQVSTAPSADSQTTEADGPMPITPKARILALAQEQSLGESFGVLLHTVALLDSGSPLAPDSEEERLSWEGYWRGLISALLCVAMHERQCAPAAAVILVRSLADKARAILRPSSQSEGEA